MIKIRMLPSNNTSLKESGYTIQQEAEIYEAQLQDILDNTREYLDNEEYMPTYKVAWKDYRTTIPTVPWKYATKGKK